MEFEQMTIASVAEPVPFHGVDNLRFKLGEHVFEALEDEDDGYRSCLETIKAVPDADDIFMLTPIARVRIEAVDHDSFEGWHLTDADDGHLWLRVGTDNADDYYPCFTFEYHPKAPPP